MCTFKTFNKISRLNSYILFGSVHCSRQSSNWDIYIYVVPVYHLNTGIEEPINIFKNYSERIHHVTESRLVCKFREIWLTGNRQSRALFTWQKNFRKVCRSRFCADRAQNLSEPAPNNRLGVPQISSKSVRFRRSYSRTRERRWNAPQSISNTRRSFFGE